MDAGARMDAGAQTDARLAELRADWPRRVTWRQVRAADPAAFRSASQGVKMLVPAVGAILLAGALIMEAPIAIPLPEWLDWGRGLFTMAALFVAIGCGIWAAVLLSMPADAKRGLAVERFAEQRGLRYSRYGAMPERVGIMFAEGRASTEGKPLYDAQFSLVLRAGKKGLGRSDVRVAVATYVGAKGDPRGPRPAFRFLSMRMPRALPHLMIDSRRNGSLRAFLPGVQRMSLEGDFDRYFTTYAPKGYERDALELLTPDVMVCLIDHGRRWDIEVVDDRLIVASSRHGRRSDRTEATALLRFAELVGEELGHQAVSYTDPRSVRPRSQVAEAGRRLRLRSAAWTTAACVLVLVAWVTLPPLVERLFG